MFSGYALSEYPNMPDRGSRIVLLSHRAAGVGCEISGEGETSADKMAAMRHPEKVGCRPDRMAAVRHPDKIERQPDRIFLRVE